MLGAQQFWDHIFLDPTKCCYLKTFLTHHFVGPKTIRNAKKFGHFFGPLFFLLFRAQFLLWTSIFVKGSILEGQHFFYKTFPYVVENLSQNRSNLEGYLGNIPRVLSKIIQYNLTFLTNLDKLLSKFKNRF